MELLKVRFTRTKEGFEFVINELKDPAALRTKIADRLKHAKDVTLEVANNCLQIKINRESLINYFHVIQTFIRESVNTAVGFPRKVATQAIQDSRALYEKVAKKYKVQKQLVFKERAPALPQVSAK
jgi:hypothetical protein